MKITNLITVKKYNAGRNGNMLISLDDELVSDQIFRVGDKELGSIDLLLCVAYVNDPDVEKILEKYVDDPAITPTDKVIVVSRKFLSLRNKTQLILLERHNRLEDDVVISCNQDRNSRANIMTISQYGSFRCKRAFGIETRIREKSEFKIGKRLRSATKKYSKQQKHNKNTNHEPDISELLHPNTQTSEPLSEEQTKKPSNHAKHERGKCYA